VPTHGAARAQTPPAAEAFPADRRERFFSSRRLCASSSSKGKHPMRKTLAFAALLSAALVLPAQAQQGPTDPQIAHIVVTANQVDIDAGKLAEKRSHNKDVKQFGKQMVVDHTAVNKSATQLVMKLKVKPEANDTSASLKKGGNENIAKLKTLKGKEFDKAYVDNEVTYHQAVIDAVDKTLVPSANNAELKALLEKVRPALVQHLEHARHLQAQLGK
jgi:putative membrane protein